MPYLHCHHCHARWDGEAAPPLGAVCGKCGKDLHCCRNCRNFAPTYEAASVAHPDIVFGKIDTEAQQELEKLANSLKETDNPVLVLVRLKK